MTYPVNILNLKATWLLQDLADLNLISLQKNPKDDFLKTVNRLHKKASPKPPSLEEITKEVESVRAKRYGQKER